MPTHRASCWVGSATRSSRSSTTRCPSSPDAPSPVPGWDAGCLRSGTSRSWCQAGSSCWPASASRSSGRSSRSASTRSSSSDSCSRPAVPAAVLQPRPRIALRLQLVHHRRPRLHAAGLSDGQHRAGDRAGRAGRGVQRSLDPRRRGPVRHADGGCDSLLRDPGRIRAADLQPLPVDARVLAPVFVYPLNGTHHYVYSVIPMEAQITRSPRRPSSA